MKIECYGKTNSSSGNWFIKYTNQHYEFFFKQADMKARYIEVMSYFSKRRFIDEMVR